MLENLPAELLRETIGHVSLCCHERKIRQLNDSIPNSPTISPQNVMSSKTVPSIATQFLYRNLVLDNLNEECAQKEKLDVVKADGLRFVKTLKVGPITGKMVTLFDHLIFKLQDHSSQILSGMNTGPLSIRN